MCSWPKGGRPALPLVYSDEVWTGIEYQVAAHLSINGLIDEGLSIVKGISERYDGVRRNPWNQIEWGNHYSRAMASYSLLLALSGYGYSSVDRSLSFMPRMNNDHFRCFFAAGSGWGSYHQELRRSALDVRLESVYGQVRLQRLKLKNETGAATVSVSALTGPGAGQVPTIRMDLGQQSVHLDFGSEIVIPAGNALTFTILPG